MHSLIRGFAPNDLATIIPDGWPGKINKGLREINENNENHEIKFITDVRQKYENINWVNTLVISSNNYALNGIRYCLEKNADIKLQCTSNYVGAIKLIDNFKPQFIVLSESGASDARDIINCLVYILYNQLDVSVLVISNGYSSFFEGFIKPWSCFYNINSNEEVGKINQVIANSLSSVSRKNSSLSDYITKQQWQTLVLLSSGMAPKEIASLLNVSLKTVSSRKISALTKLGIYEKPQEAWLMSALREHV